MSDNSIGALQPTADRATAASQSNPQAVSSIAGIPSAWRSALLEAYCTDRCAEFGDPPCSKVAPDEGYCVECIDAADQCIWIVNRVAAAVGNADAPKDGDQ